MIIRRRKIPPKISIISKSPKPPTPPPIPGKSILPSILPRKKPPIPANILLPNPPKAGRLVKPRLPKPDLLEPKEPKRDREPKDLLLKRPLEPLKPKLLIPPNLLASAIEPIYEDNSLELLEKSVKVTGNEIKKTTDIFISKFEPGDFLSVHNDTNLGRYAFIIYLNDNYFAIIDFGDEITAKVKLKVNAE